MKITKVFYLSVFGISAAAVFCLSGCTHGEDQVSMPELNTATVTSFTDTVTVSSAVTVADAAVTEPTAATSTAVSETVTSASVTSADEAPANGALTDAQLEEIRDQQKRQLEALTIGNKSRYLELINSRKLFAVLYGKEADKLSEKELSDKITHAEDEHFRINSLVFSDTEIAEIAELVCVPVSEAPDMDGIGEYKITYKAVIKTARINMEGTVLVDHGRIMSVSMIAEGMIP